MSASINQSINQSINRLISVMAVQDKYLAEENWDLDDEWWVMQCKYNGYRLNLRGLLFTPQRMWVSMWGGMRGYVDDGIRGMEWIKYV
jgi:predicted transglutaminase-like cysteine proteinase